MNKKLKLLITLFFSVFIISACGAFDLEVNPDIKVQLSINKNQTIDIEIDMLMDRVSFDVFNRTEAILDDLVTALRKEGFRAEIIEQGNRLGISAFMRIDNRGGAHASDFQFNIDDILEVRDYIIVSDYIVDKKFNIRDMIIEANLLDNIGIVERLLEQASIELVVKLPIKPVEHNADRESDSGRSLSWDIDAINENHIQVRLTVPNIDKIAYFLAISVATFIVLIFLIRKILMGLRKRKL